MLRREDFRLIHISIQRNPVHLLVEAAHKTALSRGMQDNRRKHREDRGVREGTWSVDP